MKNLFKIFGIVALVAAIGFSMTSCLSLGGGMLGGLTDEEREAYAASAAVLEAQGHEVNTVPADSGSGYESMPVIAWLSDSEWGRYGLSGLRQPAGTRLVGQVQGTGTMLALLDADRAVYDNIKGQIQGMSGWTLLNESVGDRPGSLAVVFMRQTATGMNTVAVIYGGGTPGYDTVAITIQ